MNVTRNESNDLMQLKTEAIQRVKAVAVVVAVVLAVAELHFFKPMSSFVIFPRCCVLYYRGDPH
jgi:hypothetical protein